LVDRQPEKRFHSLIQRALDRAGGLYRVDDVLGEIQAGGMQFWPGQESCMVTQLMNYPGGKTIRFAIGAGDLDEIVLMEAFIAAQAKAHQGAVKAEIIGRPGWKAALPAYNHVQIQLLRDL